jgi:hypothetical protein
MKNKLTTAWATVYAATMASVTTVYTRSMKFETDKELAKMNHKLELERMQYKSDMSDSSLVSNKTMIREDTLNDLVKPVKQVLTKSTDSPMQQLISSVNHFNADLSSIKLNPTQGNELDSLDLNKTSKASFDLDTLFGSFSEHTTLQLACISFFLYSLAILICVVGLIVNYYVKLYGNLYMKKLPKWSLLIVRYYLKLGEYTNYSYIITILTSLLFSIALSLFLYITDFIQ